MPQKVDVGLGDRSYEIRIGPGLLAKAGEMLASLRPNAKCAVVSDENVMRAHGDLLGNSLRETGIAHEAFAVSPGEGSKSFTGLEKVCGFLLDSKLERGDLVVAFGGGVVGDLAGFAAACVRRGMDFVQVPTTLLAQVDSSVGGKTAINTAQGKNLVGAFHQPILVLADIDLLRTLPRREFAAGYAEVAKYGLIDKPDFFSWLEASRDEIFAFGPALEEAIAVSCRAKAEIVAADERETGRRALLNLGHTFAHALEGAVGYDSARLVHGEAVSIGLALAHQFSNRLNLCGVEDAERVVRHLRAAGLPTAIADIPGEPLAPRRLIEFIAQDKKVARGALTFILTKGIGRAYIARDVPPPAVLSFLEESTAK